MEKTGFVQLWHTQNEKTLRDTSGQLLEVCNVVIGLTVHHLNHPIKGWLIQIRSRKYPLEF